MKKKNILWLFALLFAYILLTSSRRWGFFGHREINRLACYTLPEPMFEFFRSQQDFLVDHAVDPDKRRYAVEGEAPRHYIDIDHYGAHPFDQVPRNWYDAVEKFTEDTLLAYGIVPWQVLRSLKSLQRAFEDRDKYQILKYASELGHYVGDAHVPLHTTENYNGQLSNQHGIHGLWETRLVELFSKDYDFFVGQASYIPHPSSFIWSAVEQSHLALDSVLLFERQASQHVSSEKKYQAVERGRTIQQNYSADFSSYYHDLLSGMVERRMRAAIWAVGSLWYTAWVNAGQPILPVKEPLRISQKVKDHWMAIEKAQNNPKTKGRSCAKHSQN